MDDLNQMTLTKFRLWSIHALKVYLSRRNRSISGDFDELAARAFCVWEERLPVDEKAEIAEQRLLSEYKDKLVVSGDVVPDPFSLTSGWKGEKDGLTAWPSMYISTYLNCTTSGEILHRLLNEYKEGKVYRYFDSERVKEVFIHNVRENSDKCILKTRVTPSQDINNKCYDVWAIVEKDITDRPGGKILSAYCTCTAGMLGSCNHVAGLLFRVEHAVKTGETKLSKTSKLSTWNVPGKAKPVMKPTKASDVSWLKGRYGRTLNKEEETQKRNMKKMFSPLNKTQKEEVKNQVKIRNDLFSILKDDIKNTCFSLLHQKKESVCQKLKHLHQSLK